MTILPDNLAINQIEAIKDNYTHLYSYLQKVYLRETFISNGCQYLIETRV